MLSFYGPKGVYPYGFTTKQILAGLKLRLTDVNQFDLAFEGDSVDREQVRDIVLNLYYPELV
jgi:hypothetical protein